PRRYSPQGQALRPSGRSGKRLLLPDRKGDIVRRLLAVLAPLLLGASLVLPAQKSLMLATTTSVDATGLLDVLSDAFAADTGITLRWIAVGTGAALKQARDGNADVVIVHARKLEDEFVRAGFGVNRRVFARNYFIVVGPADDPAHIAGA